jgi:hypothetical protein
MSQHAWFSPHHTPATTATSNHTGSERKVFTATGPARVVVRETSCVRSDLAQPWGGPCGGYKGRREEGTVREVLRRNGSGLYGTMARAVERCQRQWRSVRWVQRGQEGLGYWRRHMADDHRGLGGGSRSRCDVLSWKTPHSIADKKKTTHSVPF